jgi:hypothetical protein
VAEDAVWEMRPVTLPAVVSSVLERSPEASFSALVTCSDVEISEPPTLVAVVSMRSL